MPKLLLTDDDEKLAGLLTEYFRRFELELVSATRPSSGLAPLSREAFDVVILDIMLPEMDGFEVCKAIRQRSEIPVIMLTARGEVMDRIIGLELGADDYLPKPFEPRELVARILSILKRTQPAATPTAVCTLSPRRTAAAWRSPAKWVRAPGCGWCCRNSESRG